MGITISSLPLGVSSLGRAHSLIFLSANRVFVMHWVANIWFFVNLSQ